MKYSESEIMNFILNGMKDIIASLDKDFKFTYFNKAMKDEFIKIYNADIHIGDSILDVLSKFPEEQIKVKKMWQRAINGEEFSYIQTFGAKQVKTYEFYYTSVTDSTGKIIGASHIVRDITEKVKLENMAKQFLEAKEKFLGSISHELRTPLNCILGFSQLLKSEGSSYQETEFAIEENTNKFEFYVNSILRSSKYLLELINNILDINSFESESFKINSQNINVYSLTKTVFNDLNVIAKNKNIKMFLEMKDIENMYVCADEKRFKQILFNLISNAIKYNTLRGEVHIKGRRTGSYLVLDIEDTGIGISNTNLKRLFIPFDRLGKESTVIEGTGLGLYIVKFLCNKMNGELIIKSKFGIGSVFSVKFAISEIKKINHSSIESSEIANEINLNFKKSILYIEDNYFNIVLMKSIINKFYPNSNFNVIKDGYEGLDFVKKQLPELVLLDLDIPTLSGVEVISYLRNNRKYDSCKIIIVTSNTNPDLKNKLFNIGYNGFISKPIMIPDLLKIINKNQ